MIFTPSDIYDIIKTNNYKSVRIYEDFITDYKTELPIEHNTFSSSDDLVKRLKDYEKLYDGKFTFLMGQGLKNEQLRHLKKYKVEFYRSYIQDKTDNESFNGKLEYVRTEEIDKKVDSLFKLRLAEMERENEIKELKNKLKEVDNLEGKLNYFLTRFVNSYFEQMSSNSSLNGVNNNNMSNFNQYTSNETTATDLNEYESALIIVVNYFGEDNIIKFAKKIKSGQAEAVKPIINNFINQ